MSYQVFGFVCLFSFFLHITELSTLVQAPFSLVLSLERVSLVNSAPAYINQV